MNDWLVFGIAALIGFVLVAGYAWFLRWKTHDLVKPDTKKEAEIKVVKAKVRASRKSDDEGSVFYGGVSFVISFVVMIIVFVVGYQIVEGVQESIGPTTSAYNISSSTLEGLGNVTSLLPIFGIVMVSIVVISTVFAAFQFVRND